MKELLEHYRKNRKVIKNRLKDFQRQFKKGDREIFSELCFCILTPQAKAVECDEIVKELKKNNALFDGSVRFISPYLKKARFWNNKAEYIVTTRKFFKKGEKFLIKKYIDEENIYKTRVWFAENKNIKGIGYKEASHFLRNIGFGKNLAILDTHILKNLKKYAVIKKIPKSMTKNKYLEIENKMRGFSNRIKIPMAELDLLLWAKETGRVFK